jgi:ADP-ribose pyrophosphatase
MPPAPSAPIPDDPPSFEPFRKVGSRQIYDSLWCSLRRDDLLLPDGSVSDHHVFQIIDAVVVVPVLPNGDLVLIGQYRYPHGRTCWEVPAGRMTKGETPAQSAERELREESGCRAGRWLELPGFFPLNGISDHWVHTFCALDCEQGDSQPDDTERILTRVFTLDEVRALLRAGRIVDAFSALALYYYLDLVRREATP